MVPFAVDQEAFEAYNQHLPSLFYEILISNALHHFLDLMSISFHSCLLFVHPKFRWLLFLLLWHSLLVWSSQIVLNLTWRTPFRCCMSIRNGLYTIWIRSPSTLSIFCKAMQCKCSCCFLFLWVHRSGSVAVFISIKPENLTIPHWQQFSSGKLYFDPAICWFA